MDSLKNIFRTESGTFVRFGRVFVDWRVTPEGIFESICSQVEERSGVKMHTEFRVGISCSKSPVEHLSLYDEDSSQT